MFDLKSIIFLEGYNDELFFKILFRENNLFSEEEIKVYDGNQKTTRDIFATETECLRSFFEIHSPYSLLMKNEGGKDKVLDCFEHFRDYLFGQEKTLESIVMVLDTDKGDENDIIQDLEKRFKERCGRKNILNTSQTKINDIYILNCDISLENGVNLGSFIIICFNPSLEKVLEIKHSYNETQKKEIIKEEIDNRGFISDILSIFQ